MTQQNILETALRQSAVDLGCAPEDFTKQHPVVVQAADSPDARKYLKLPAACYRSVTGAILLHRRFRN